MTSPQHALSSPPPLFSSTPHPPPLSLICFSESMRRVACQRSSRAGSSVAYIGVRPSAFFSLATATSALTPVSYTALRCAACAHCSAHHALAFHPPEAHPLPHCRPTSTTTLQSFTEPSGLRRSFKPCFTYTVQLSGALRRRVPRRWHNTAYTGTSRWHHPRCIWHRLVVKVKVEVPRWHQPTLLRKPNEGSLRQVGKAGMEEEPRASRSSGRPSVVGSVSLWARRGAWAIRKP